MRKDWPVKGTNFINLKGAGFEGLIGGDAVETLYRTLHVFR
jgi:hypothetical protein